MRKPPVRRGVERARPKRPTEAPPERRLAELKPDDLAQVVGGTGADNDPHGYD